MSSAFTSGAGPGDAAVVAMPRSFGVIRVEPRFPARPRLGPGFCPHTKWKLINQANRSDKYGISQADIYQLFGYTKKYLENQQQREVLLVYPASDTFTDPLEPFWYRKGHEVLYVVPYDLDNETLILPTDSLLHEDVHLIANSL